MPNVFKNFRCFRCHFPNTVSVPHYFKGIKCQLCRTFNFFNYIPNYKRKKNLMPNLSNNNRNKHINIKKNKIRININPNSSINHSSHSNFNTYNNILLNSLNNRNNAQIINIMNHSNRNIYEENQENSILLNNHTENLFERRPSIHNEYANLNTDFSNNFISFNCNVPEIIKFPWLNKQKMTEEIKKKYKNEKCSICLDEFNGDISISKCHHIFHYKCISNYIDNTGKKDCPICRSNLQTGEKKRIEVNRNIYEGRINENNFLNNILIRNNSLINSLNQNFRSEQRRNEINLNDNRYNQISNNNESNNNFGICLIIFMILIIWSKFSS